MAVELMSMVRLLECWFTTTELAVHQAAYLPHYISRCSLAQLLLPNLVSKLDSYRY